MRNRMINQSMVDSRSLARVSLGAALLFTWLLMLVDDEGLMPLDRALIHRRIFGMRDDVTEADTSAWLDELAWQDCIRFYDDADEEESYLAVTNFYFYQTINKPGASKCPPPPWDHRPAEQRENGKITKRRCERMPVKNIVENCGKGCEKAHYGSATVALPPNRKERKGREEGLLLRESPSFSSLDGEDAAVKSDRRATRLSQLFGILGKEGS